MIVTLALAISGFFILGALLTSITHRVQSANATQRKNNWIKYLIFLAIINFILVAAGCGRPSLIIFIAVILLAAAYELRINLKRIVLHSSLLTGLSLFAIAVCLSHLLFFRPINWFSAFAFVFLIVAVADSFSQLIGRLKGKHPLCTNLSPHKTVEGAIGGILASLTAAAVFRFLHPDLNLPYILSLGFIISLSAMTGDLVFSAIKRKLEIKDFSGILPGHGGILDRFDSLIIASPVYYWALKTIHMLTGGVS